MNLHDYIPEGVEVVYMCIGTDRSTGDCLGPLVGSKLKEFGVPNVYGTLKDTVHAVNLREKTSLIDSEHPDAFVVAIDASLGSFSRVGKISFGAGPLNPGAGVGKDLPKMGNINIQGIVNVAGFMEYYVLQNTKLSLVMEMADEIVSEILRFHLQREVASQYEGVQMEGE